MREPIYLMYSRILNIFSSQFRKKILSSDDFAHLVELYNSNTKSPLKLFLNSSVDITSYWKSDTKMKETIYEMGVQVEDFVF
jgi:hypothetical protein